MHGYLVCFSAAFPSMPMDVHQAITKPEFMCAQKHNAARKKCLVQY